MKDSRSPVRYISQFLKALWLFFPGILFLLLTVLCFWVLGQGKDLIVAFVDNNSGNNAGFSYTRIIFFMIIGFWVYVSWYSSRIISYIKKKQQEDQVKRIVDVHGEDGESPDGGSDSEHEIGKRFLDGFPIMIGNACFLVLELAVLQVPIISFSISSTAAMIIFILALIALRYIGQRISRAASATPAFRRTFWILISLFLLSLVVVSFIADVHIIALFVLLLLFHVIFIYYTNLRRIDLAKNVVPARIEKNREVKATSFERTMDFFCVPRKEKGYYKWFLIIGLAGIIIYFINIVSLAFARHLGPFPTVILAFAVLLAFGNVVTAFSVRYKVNFHFLLFLLAFIIGSLHETHNVRTIELESSNNYATRPELNQYLINWLNERDVMADSSEDGYEVYFVMANGGASRSGYWTASVLGTIEDASILPDTSSTRPVRFSDRVFCLSGTSGGGVGVATFFAMLRNKQQHKGRAFARSTQEYLRNDYFTHTFARMLGPDFFNYIIPFSSRMDRAAALERSFEISANETKDSVYRVPFEDNFSSFPALRGNKINLPILCINTTRMQDGNPGIVSNLKIDSATFNNRVDVVRLLTDKTDISITSASILGARFPYLSPAGKIADNYFVDGGYFDNSGAGVVQELIRGIINIGRRDSMQNGSTSLLYQQVKKLHFKVLHITNSPVIADSSAIRSVAPIKNDLLAPILTIVGAYDMQTTVNDGRLVNYIKDLDSFSGNRSDYTMIPLYKDSAEWKHDELRERFDTEPGFAMNWFMSDTTRNRINKRLMNHSGLRKYIKEMNAPGIKSN